MARNPIFYLLLFLGIRLAAATSFSYSFPVDTANLAPQGVNYPSLMKRDHTVLLCDVKNYTFHVSDYPLAL
jgi:hypothetical protein